MSSWILAAGAAVVVTGCGGDGSGDEIVLDSRPATAAPPATTPEPTEPAATEPSPTPTGTIAPPTSTGAPVTSPSVGGSWTEASTNLTGMSSECGNVSVVSDPASGLFFAGIALQGLFARAADSDQWTHVGDGGDPIPNRPQQVLADPVEPTTFWEAGIYGSGVGVLRTDDGGQSFVSLESGSNTDYISVDFTDPARETMLLGAHEASVPHISTDGGESWRDVTGLPSDIGYASAPHIVDSRTFLFGTFNGPNSGVFRSTDAGATWTKVFESGVIGAPVVRDGTMQWLGELGSGLASSTDGGITWTFAESGSISRNATQLVAMPDGSLVTLGGTSLVQSSDGGTQWLDVGPPLPYQPNHVAYSVTEQAFYVSRFDCSFTDDNPVKPDAIMRLAVG